MKIVFLDAKTIGDDIDLSAFEKLGEVVTYNFSTTEIIEPIYLLSIFMLLLG